MHRILVRIKNVKSNQTFEAYFDERLSLKDNLLLLEELCETGLSQALVYEPNKKIFLDRNIPLKDFGSNGFISLDIFI
ncbi:MAG: hypothetical protein IJI46_06960 [Erysipelotrichaceae bacterium]|nr:hypothetical protein [Erysipelotrichaceae bacterium]